ncbi:hypothetical protein L9G74_17285 [Shewanella sp. C32]|uniref:Uncharacterized protein n=1 Tax=Shewanella electrica TaxID=515560 RepID=A0ABT2FRG2_9GAMM|nr:hypothetical protein [Shewanella electrica]MCH1926574.1 hypothetical protein [Shewanella electrica]MCS4558195.1 hypothetical protein [Shewanella electrica]
MQLNRRVFLAQLLLCFSLLSIASTAIAKEKSAYDLLMERAISKPHEVELARKGIAETSIDRAWERPCPYRELRGTEEEEKEFLYHCERWNDCVSTGGAASIFTEGYYKNQQLPPDAQVPWTFYQNLFLDGEDLASATGHLKQHALKFAEDNWRLFEGRDAHETSDMVEDKFWQWCSAEPLTLWKADDL